MAAGSTNLKMGKTQQGILSDKQASSKLAKSLIEALLETTLSFLVHNSEKDIELSTLQGIGSGVSPENNIFTFNTHTSQ